MGTVTLTNDSTLTARVIADGKSIRVSAPYILTHQDWINPAPNELHLVAPDGTRQEFIVVDRARFERLLAAATHMRDTTEELGWSVTSVESLQTGDLDSLPET